MRRILRDGRLAILAFLLLLGSAGAAARTATTAHAANPPTITATGSNAWVWVSGAGFTPNGSVLVQVYDTNWNLEVYNVIKAAGPHTYCRYGPIPVCGLLDPGGEISTGLGASTGYVNVMAYDYGSSSWSNWSTTYVSSVR
ncbi:MAG: hypothetical protein JOZ41_19220 [Chloroflexi bacterium]|nr:hypothetical protein [Chloroflexota bacterium]